MPAERSESKPVSKRLAAKQGKSQEAGGGEQSTRHLDPRFWSRLYMVLFVVVEGCIILFFTTCASDSSVRVRMQKRAQSQQDAGNYDKAIETLTEYANRFPGAWDSAKFQRWIGQVYLADGNHEKAAEFLAKSADGAPETWDVKAEAGEALWKSGRKEEAIKLWNAELKLGNPNNDRANYYLGLAASEAGDIVSTYAHFQAITDKAAFEKELEAVRAKVEKDYLTPARAAADQFIDSPAPPKVPGAENANSTAKPAIPTNGDTRP